MHSETKSEPSSAGKAAGPPEKAPKSEQERSEPLRQIGRWLRIIGPGTITGAADDDPSGIGTYSQAGAAFGTGQLWLALYMLPLLIAVQEMCARVGLVTGSGIATLVRVHYRRPVVLVAVGLVFMANTLNIGADLGAMAATVQLLVPDVASPPGSSSSRPAACSTRMASRRLRPPI